MGSKCGVCGAEAVFRCENCGVPLCEHCAHVDVVSNPCTEVCIYIYCPMCISELEKDREQQA